MEEGGTGQDRERHRKETVCVSGSRVGVSEQSFVVGADNKLQQDKCIKCGLLHWRSHEKGWVL